MMVSADGSRWTPKASWSCNQNWCNTEGAAHAIANDHNAEALTVEFDASEAVRYVGISFGSGATFMSEFGLSEGTVINCIDECPGGTEPPVCPAGQTSDGEAECQSCPAGTFAPEGTSEACDSLRCPRGTVDHDSDPATACAACPGQLEVGGAGRCASAAAQTCGTLTPVILGTKLSNGRVVGNGCHSTDTREWF